MGQDAGLIMAIVSPGCNGAGFTMGCEAIADNDVAAETQNSNSCLKFMI